jgi:hypothetical protein
LDLASTAAGLCGYPVIQCYPSGEGQYQGAAKLGEELVMDCRVEKAGVLDGFESIESIESIECWKI